MHAIPQFSPTHISYFSVSYEAERFIAAIILMAVAIFCCNANTAEYIFSKIEGAGDPRIRSIIQLPDRRIAFATDPGIDIFDGSKFTHLYKATGDKYGLAGYDGHHHLYISHDGRYLWIKDFHQLQCIDLDTEIFSTDVGRTLRDCGVTAPADNFFADRCGRIWIVADTTLTQPDSGFFFSLDPGKGDLLDLAADEESLYLFYRDGNVSCVDLASGKESYSIRAYDDESAHKFESTSHMIENSGGFYQIRNGSIGGLFSFDPESRRWHTLLESNLRLNTLAVSDNAIFISTPDGLLSIDPGNSLVSHIPHLRTRSGNILASELSTISIDESGCIWIGTYNRGIYCHNPKLYNHFSLPKSGNTGDNHEIKSSPFSENQDGTINVKTGVAYSKLHFPSGKRMEIDTSGGDDYPAPLSGEYGSEAVFISSNGGLFFDDPDSYSIYIPNDSAAADLTRKPFLSGIRVNSREIQPLKAYDGEVILRKIPSRTGKVILKHFQNFITFEISNPDLTDLSSKFYYRLDGIDPEWRTSSSSDIRDRMFSTTYTALPPGEYTFRSRLSMNPDSPEIAIGIKVLHPWWSSPGAICIYSVIALAIAILCLHIYIRRMKKRIEAEHREQSLLARIRQLIDEVDRYKSESDSQRNVKGKECNDDSPELSGNDRAFIARAMEIVENNLNTPGYSVVQLSADMHMDRTGLYRKLTALLDRSPSLFIRDIRLRRAAMLIKEGNLSITEIAEVTGFSSTSYMSKCFQERYGCKPSEYSKLASEDGI